MNFLEAHIASNVVMGLKKGQNNVITVFLLSAMPPVSQCQAGIVQGLKTRGRLVP